MEFEEQMPYTEGSQRIVIVIEVSDIFQEDAYFD